MPIVEVRFKREPGNGKVAARLILKSATLEEAEAVLERFEEIASRTNEAYPSVALANKCVESDMNHATDLFLHIYDKFSQEEVMEAEEYVRRHWPAWKEVNSTDEVES